MLLTGLLLVGCTTTSPAGPAAPDPTPDRFSGAASPPPTDHVRFGDATIAAGYGSDQPDGAFPRTVRHAGGNTVIQAAPQRVVVLSGGQLDALLSLELVPVAATHGQDADLVPDYLRTATPALAPALDRIADAGARTEPNLEAVATAQPDLILGNASGVGDLAPQLTKIAPLVLTDGDPLNWRSDYLLLAAALGREAQAHQVLQRLSAGVEALAGRLTERPVVSLVRLQGDRIRSLGTGSTAGMVLAEVGLPRPVVAPAGEVSADVAAEELTKIDGDWILYGSLGSADGAAAVPADAAGALWPTLQAVQQGRARPVDDAVWFQNAGPLATRTILDQLGRMILP